VIFKYFTQTAIGLAIVHYNDLTHLGINMILEAVKKNNLEFPSFLKETKCDNSEIKKKSSFSYQRSEERRVGKEC
jgi:hypothetical protein